MRNKLAWLPGWSLDIWDPFVSLIGYNICSFIDSNRDINRGKSCSFLPWEQLDLYFGEGIWKAPYAEKHLQFVRFIICIIYYYLLLKVHVSITPPTQNYGSDLSPNAVHRELTAPYNIHSQMSLIMFSLKFPVHCTFFSQDFQSTKTLIL